jgi:hypothetical protein
MLQRQHMVVSLTAAKIKPLIFSIFGSALSYVANMFVIMIPIRFLLYSLTADLTENTACNNSSVVACVTVAAIASWLLTVVLQRMLAY